MEVGLGWTEESSAGEIMNRSRKKSRFLGLGSLRDFNGDGHDGW